MLSMLICQLFMGAPATVNLLSSLAIGRVLATSRVCNESRTHYFLHEDYVSEYLMPRDDNLVISNPKYYCPKHGNIGPAIIESTMEGHEGRWCQRCWAESLDALGVLRVEEVME